MKVDKYDVTAKSGAPIWVIVEHGTDISSVALQDGYAIKEFVETFEFDDNSELMLKYDVVMSCMKKNGYFFGTSNAGCQI